ncbi:hypothetical protein SRDD_32920 [Serratia sp. DD3]|nr:hypothetical protein SRDD_32920 [Serratia sp. DD3]
MNNNDSGLLLMDIYKEGSSDQAMSGTDDKSTAFTALI